jgi:hypothetical protein
MIQLIFTVLAIIFGVVWYFWSTPVIWLLCIGCGTVAAILYLNNSTRREMQNEESIYW